MTLMSPLGFTLVPGREYTGGMNKKVVMIFAVIGMTVGGCLPLLWGDSNMFGVASILLGMIGGFAGIWLAMYIGKRYL